MTKGKRLFLKLHPCPLSTINQTKRTLFCLLQICNLSHPKNLTGAGNVPNIQQAPIDKIQQLSFFIISIILMRFIKQECKAKSKFTKSNSAEEDTVNSVNSNISLYKN